MRRNCGTSTDGMVVLNAVGGPPQDPLESSAGSCPRFFFWRESEIDLPAA
jgi:hypothetical protein